MDKTIKGSALNYTKMKIRVTTPYPLLRFRIVLSLGTPTSIITVNLNSNIRI